MKLEINRKKEIIIGVLLFLSFVSAGVLGFTGLGRPAAWGAFLGALVFPALLWFRFPGQAAPPSGAVRDEDREERPDPCGPLREALAARDRVLRRLTERNLLPALSGTVQGDEKLAAEVDRRAETALSAAGLNEIFYLVPYLKKLLGVITGKTEEAALGLMEAFVSIQQKTSETARQGKSILREFEGKGDGGTVRDLIRDSLSQVEEEWNTMREMTASARDMAEKMEKLRGMVDESTSMLKQINDITERSNLIGINLSIEASRIGGSAGRAFKVIAHELNRLNDRTAAFSGDIARRLAELQGSFDETRLNVTKTYESVIARMEERSGMLKESVERLASSYDNFSRISAVISESAIGVNTDMDSILEHLQFQDITRQEVETVRDALAYIEDSLKAAGGYFSLCGRPLEKNIEISETVARKLLTRTKVQDEREAIMEVVNEHSRG